jgi:hypothetical protein
MTSKSTSSKRRSPSSCSFSALASTNSRLTLDLLTPQVAAISGITAA